MQLISKLLSLENRKKLVKAKKKLNFLGENVHIDETVIITRPEKVKIGNDVSIQKNCVISGKGGITIGEGSIIANDVQILSAEHNFDAMDIQAIPFDDRYIEEEVVIGEYVWIGSHALILPGVNIQKGAVVAAGAVVTKDVRPYAVVAGCPAKEIKQRPNIERFQELEKSKRSLFKFRKDKLQ